MSIFFDVSAILEAAKVPPGIPAPEETAFRIAKDGEVRTIAMQLAIDGFVQEALRSMTAGQIDVLHKRCRVPVAAKPGKVEWTVTQGQYTQKPQIRASRNGESFTWSGNPDNAQEAGAFGERVPDNVVALYRQRYADFHAVTQPIETPKRTGGGTIEITPEQWGM